MTYREELKNARRLILARIAELQAAPPLEESYDPNHTYDDGTIEVGVYNAAEVETRLAAYIQLGASVAEYIRAEQVEEASLPPIPEFERPNEPLTTLEKELIGEMMRYLDEVSVVIAQSDPRGVAKMLARLRGARPI